MFGIDPITVASLMILAGNSVSCPNPPTTKINIIPHTEKVKYDYKQSLKEIQEYSTDTVDPYGFHGTTITQGFMSGEIGLDHKVTLGQVTNSRRGYSCIWYKDITINITIDPTIVIAKELYNDRCMRKAILDHELKHVRVDRKIVNKYANLIGAKLMSELKTRGFSAGPMHIKDTVIASKKMQRVVNQIIELEYKKLSIDRQESQRAVDNLEEYKSVDNKCPAFEKQKKQLYTELLK